ncbi:hypothetical protein APHHGE2_1236 [Anaplasma phagocytophilum str. HGE2]|nr:hypothetical protein APHHGE2_1236 [Anaplasma phagocytophilum str. HGE2]
MVTLFYLVASVCLCRRKHRYYPMKTGFSFKICGFCEGNFLEVYRYPILHKTTV